LVPFRPPIAANSSAYTTLWDNHAELYALYSGVIGDHASGDTPLTTQLAFKALWRFTSRGGADFSATTGLKLKLTILATASGGAPGSTSGTIGITDSGPIASVNILVPAVSGDVSTYTITVNPLSVDAKWEIGHTVVTGRTITIWAWSAEWVGTDGNRAFPSGYRRGAANWKAANAPISTEGFGRLMKAPSAIATDRPCCVFSHFAAVGVAFGAPKTKEILEQLWGAYSGDYQRTAGIGLIPQCDSQARTYTVDWYFRSTGASVAKILIGGLEIAVPTQGVWGSATFTLSPGEHEISVAITPLVGQGAYFEALQVWRGN